MCGAQKMSRRRRAGWLPNQHGAWAMLLWPYGIGLYLAIHDGHLGWYALPLFGTWMAGYFAFHATSQWLKSRRNARYQQAVITYSAATAVLGLITWALAGWPLAWWTLPFIPLLGIALAMAAARHERDLLAGLLTVAAASLITLVVGWPHPGELAAWEASKQAAVVMAAIAFAYFGGTVWYVKTMIRQRGKAGWLVASIGWHTLATTAVATLAATGQLSWWWTPFFAATTARSAILPLVWPMRGRVLRPKAVGLIEIGFTLAAAVIAITTAGR